MSNCPLDHSLEDVLKKLEEQKMYLPETLFGKCQLFLSDDLKQTTLNDVFHLLKKYDLASVEIKEERNKALQGLFS